VKKENLIIGICGGSGSGKTTIIEELMHLMKEHQPALLSLDNYYKGIDEQARDAQGHVNFDLPGAIDSDRFCQDLERLKSGENIRIKKYHFNIRDKEEFIEISSSRIILTEGIFLFNIPEAMAMIDVKIYVELDHEIQLKRRLQRDVQERGYDKVSVLYQWENHVLPAYKSYIQIHKDKADLVLRNDGDKQFLVNLVDQFILSHPVVNEFCFS
jgi:uridine kinase